METFTTGELAKASGTGVQTVLYYERIGLLPEPPRTPAGHRRYRFGDVRRMRFVRHAQTLGFSLEEIRDLLELRVSPGESCTAVGIKADDVIGRIDATMTELQVIRASLEVLREACRTKTPTSDCPILDAIEEYD